MRVLVACEFSGIVRDAFAERGHDAWSCDLLPTERPGNHIQGDVTEILGNGWDLMVAHPPCTYLSRAGARWMHAGGSVDPNRYAKAMEAREFFLMLLNADIPRVAVENPRPLRIVGLPPHSAVVEPYWFGHGFSKRTLLWLKNLPPLLPTIAPSEHTPFVRSNSGAGRRKGQRWSPGQNSGGLESARTFPGIARAMAEQWGALAQKDEAA